MLLRKNTYAPKGGFSLKPGEKCGLAANSWPLQFRQRVSLHLFLRNHLIRGSIVVRDSPGEFGSLSFGKFYGRLLFGDGVPDFLHEGQAFLPRQAVNP